MVTVVHEILLDKGDVYEITFEGKVIVRHGLGCYESKEENPNLSMAFPAVRRSFAYYCGLKRGRCVYKPTSQKPTVPDRRREGD